MLKKDLLMLHNLTFKQKVLVLLVLLTFIGIVSLMFRVSGFEKLQYEFFIYKDKAIQGKISTLNIKVDLNYISRCNRDIILGNSYDGNIKKIIQRIKSIDSEFELLKQTVKNTPKEADKLQLVEKSQTSTMRFVNESLVMMKSLRNKERTIESLQSIYKEYKEKNDSFGCGK
jgi:methyl-accepting chemotaxis protein